MWGVEKLSVDFGHAPALRDIDLEVGRGESVAVIGGDGAGKTTLLRILAGVPLPHRGAVRIPRRERLGYVPASGGVYPDLTVSENLDFVADAYGLRRGDDRRAELLEQTGLAPFTDRLAGDLSGGMRRKLAVVGAMLHKPELLVLDEPTTGIDPVSRTELWRLVVAAMAGGASVVVSSAYIDEAERASSILVLQDGAVVVSGELGAVLASMPGSVVETEAPDRSDRAWRHGAVWREWIPDRVDPSTPPDLEDVVIVAALRQELGVA